MADNGSNEQSEEYDDMLLVGTIDQTRVTPTALQNAVSIAGPMITTGWVIADKPSENNAPAGMSDGGGNGTRYGAGAAAAQVP